MKKLPSQGSKHTPAEKGRVAGNEPQPNARVYKLKSTLNSNLNNYDGASNNTSMLYKRWTATATSYTRQDNPAVPTLQTNAP